MPATLSVKPENRKKYQDRKAADAHAATAVLNGDELSDDALLAQLMDDGSEQSQPLPQIMEAHSEAALPETPDEIIEATLPQGDELNADDLALLADAEPAVVVAASEPVTQEAKPEPVVIAANPVVNADPDMALLAGLLESAEQSDATANLVELEKGAELPKAKKGRTPSAKKAKADAPATADAPAEPKAPKAPKGAKEPNVMRNVTSRKSDKIGYTTSEDPELLCLDVRDRALSVEEQEEKRVAILSEVDKLAVKVGEKAVQLFCYLKSGERFNEVMKRAFTVLLTDGELTSGQHGNLQQNLLAKPYSEGTSRSQANQIFALFPTLKITIIDGKGKQVANEHSTILAKVKAELGL